MARTYNSSRGDDILKKYGVDENAPSGSKGQEDNDDARRILAKYGMGDYTDAEKAELANWQKLIAGTDGLYSRASRQLNREGWRNYQNDAQFRSAIDEKVQSVEDYLKGINQSNVTYKQAKEYLRALQQMQQGYQYRSDYFGQFSDENDYNMKQKVMDEAIAQLQNTDWSGYQGDRSYEDRINDMRRSATKYLQNLDPNSPYYQQAKNYVAQLDDLQGAYQSREDFYGQFADEKDYTRTTGLYEDLNKYVNDGGSYEDYYSQAKDSAAAAKQQYEDATRQRESIEQMLGDLRAYMYYPDQYAQEWLSKGRPALNTQQERAQYQQYLEQQLELARGEEEMYLNKANEANIKSTFARYSMYNNYHNREDFREGVEAGKAAYEAHVAQRDASRPSYAENYMVGSAFSNGNPMGGLMSAGYKSAYEDSSYYEPNERWSDEQRNTFYYLWENQGQEAAIQYGADVNTGINTVHQAQQGAEYATWAAEHPLVTAVMHIAASPIQTAEFLDKAVQVQAHGSYVPRYDMAPGTATSTMMAAAAQKLNEKGTLPEWLPAIGGKGLGDAYQLATSIAQSMLTARLGGGATNLLFFGEAANSGFDEAKARGASDEQALIMGALNGAAEVIGETVSIERLVKMKSPASFRRWLVETMKQGGVEASEEVFTTLLNTVSDAVVMGDKSQLQTSIREKMADGMSREQAEKEAWQEWFNDIAYDAVGGFLSGGVSGGLQQGLNVATASRTEYSGRDKSQLIEAALQQGENSKAYQLAQKIQQQGTMSVQEATRLKELMPQASERITSQQRVELASQVRERLGSDASNSVVLAAVNKLMGEELTKSEQKALDNADEGTQQKIQALSRETALVDRVMFNQAQQSREKRQASDKASEQLKQAFTASKLEISDSDMEVLTDGYHPSQKLNTYVLAMRDAYRLGKSGMTLDQAKANSQYAGKVEETQFQHAWQLGDDTRTVDFNTTEGKEEILSKLAGLGEFAEAAAAAYQGGQSVNKYSEQMTRAASLYAAAGADVASVAKAVNLLGLTAEQMKVAQEMGAKIRLERQSAVKQAQQTMVSFRQRAAEILKGDQTAKDIEDLDKAISEAQAYVKAEKKKFQEQVAALKEMAKENPEAEKSDSYRKDLDEANSGLETIQQVQQLAKDLAQKRRALEGESVVKRKKGTINFDGGKINGVKVAAVDRTKLNRQQKRIVAMVTALADAVNLDYVFYMGRSNEGGAYEQGGKIFINLNAGGANTLICAATLSHELTHFLQEYAPEEYQQLKDFVIEKVLKASPAEFERLMQQQAKWEPGKDWDYLQNELVANACQEMLLNDKVITQLARENMRLAEKVQDVIANLKDKILKAFESVTWEHGPFDAAKAVRTSLDEIADLWAKGIHAATESYNAEQTLKAAGESVVREVAKEEATQVGSYDLKDFADAKTPDGDDLFQIFAFEHDEDQYRQMLTKWGGMSSTEIDELFNTVDAAMAKIMKNLEALDYAWEEDIDDRGFQAIKQNSDKLYKVSLDFSTLCRKRLLQGLIAGQLSAALQRGLSKEEGIAVRDALLAIQAEGKQIEVACALCYVESARMRSQKAIQEFLNDREGALRNYYANQRGREAVAKAEREERQAIYNELLKADKAAGKPMSEWGLVRGKGDDATMYDIRDSKKAKIAKIPTAMKKRIQDAKKAARAGYALTEEQQATVDHANSLPVEAFTTPEGLQELAKSKYRDIFNAFVLKVSAASKSKGIENDTWWRAGDSQAVGDALIRQMNAENGLRTQSWSDFTVKHLMDYIAATIELSTRGAKQHAYTKVLDYVDLMGRTGLMINMSLIPARDYNGKLEYDPVEGINYDGAMKMREKFPDTAGTICIGITVDQIHQLLDSMDIDYVIPYHASGMSKDTRKLMHIPAWENFQDYQSEKKLSGSAARENARKYGVELLSENDPLWHEGPSFSEWFDLEKARATAKRVGKTGKYGVMTGGYAAMQEAAENYKRICAQRGLAPKFSYGSAAFDADFSNDAGYWKLLIDRKMVNNKTGEIIEQRALKPTFDFDTVQRILDDELKRYPGVKADQENAILRVTRSFLKGDVKAGMSSEEIAKVMQTPVDNVPITNITQNAAQMQKWDDLSADEKQRVIQENKAFNEGQTKTGSPLRTLKGSTISRGGTINKVRYPVGKVIGGRLYLHKDYVDTAIQVNPEFGAALHKAEQALRAKYPDFEFNCINYHPASGEIQFQEAPGFDIEREPVVGLQVTVEADGTVSDMKPFNQIWHHKWQWVGNDYSGFDVRENWEWSKKWLSTILGASKGGSLKSWNGQLAENNLPEQKKTAQYQLFAVEPVQPSSDDWERGLTEEEALAIYPDMWDTSKAKQKETEEEKRKRDSTQRANTLSTYGKIYDILKREGFTGKILDASSGLGLGTQLGRSEKYGFDVTDIEPYPGPEYHPMYMDYSTHFGQYDVIISSAVLNVVAQDQRDALVVKMGQLLKKGGKMYVTTRTTVGDVDNLAKSGKNIQLGPHEYIETVHNHYQKGFTNTELQSYLQDALGDEFTVEIATGKNKFNNNTAVIVTKVGRITADSTDQERYEILKNKKVRPADANTDLLDSAVVERLVSFDKLKESGDIRGKDLSILQDIMRNIATKLKINGIDLKNSSISFPFRYSNKNVSKSTNHQKQYSGSFSDLAKALSCIKDLVNGAQLIEVHREKKTGTTKENEDLKQTYVLVGAMREGPRVVPVEMVVKEFYSSDAGLYMTVTISNNKDSGVVGKASAGKAAATQSLFPKSTISIADLIRDVKAADSRLLKYFPDQMLSEEQIEYKKQALARQERDYDAMRVTPEAQRQAWSEGEIYNDRALVSEETLDKWMSGSWYGASDPNYAQAYITSMSPSQYLKLTTLYDEDRIRAESKGRTMDWAKEVSESQPIQLHIDTETGKVEGHEGRHRMAVLAENGITEVPVLLFDMSNKYSKKPMKELVLRGQDFHGETNISRATVLDVYPLNRTYREQIVNDYSRKTGMEKMSEKYQGKQTLQFQKWDQDHNDWAPTFYSKMDRVVSDWTNGKGQKLPPKMAANQVVGWLRGKGVKAEEIRWSGIVPWLEGRKTVTQQELQAVMAGNEVKIETKVLGAATGRKKSNAASARWGFYNLPGGVNYREILFKIPDLAFTNGAMQMHWGVGESGIVSHTRVQDFPGFYSYTLYAEEIQSDLHNAGAANGFSESGVPDVPFAGSADTYYEYVMKQLLRLAAEHGYTTIAWPTADILSKRFGDKYREAYRIEYDQNIPKFMNKYVKQWGAKVAKTTLENNGAEVWSVELTDAMRESVLHEGQPLFQRWSDVTDDTTAEAQGRQEAASRLQAENAVLSQTVKELQALSKKQKGSIEKLQKMMQLTRTPETRLSDAKKLARTLLSEYSGRVDVDELAAQLKSLGDYLLQTDTDKLNEKELKDRARAIAAEIVDSAQEKITDAADTYKEIADRIKGRKVSIEERYTQEIGDFEIFRKSLFGKLTVARRESGARENREGYTTVDQFYSELQEDYGKGWFPESLNEGEQLQILSTILDNSRPMEVNPFERYEAEATEEIANRILRDTMEGALRPTEPTKADKAKSRQDALRQQILDLKRQNALSEREAGRLWQTVYDLSIALDKAESRQKSLEAGARYRQQQLIEEGRSRAAEVQARERERSAEKIKALKEYYRDMAERYRDRRNESAGASKYRKQVEVKAAQLYEMLRTNSDKLHVPQALKAPLAEFLETLDFTSKRALAGGNETARDRVFGARLLELGQILENQQRYISGDTSVKQDFGSYLDISEDSLQFLRDSAEMITQAMREAGGFTINQMSAQQLKDLAMFLQNLKAAINNMNNFMANERYASVREAADADIAGMEQLGRAPEIAENKILNTFLWKNGTPYYIMKRFGEGGASIFRGFAKGWAQMAFDAREIIDFTEQAYTDKEVKAWKKEIHEITLEDGSKIRMTTAQIMELSQLLGREQARKHILKGGIRIGNIETRKGGKGDTTHYHLTDADIQQILGKLTDRQMAVAKALQRFMADKGAEWGNEVSMKRFGYQFYEEGPGYYPIRTDNLDRPMADTDIQTNSMFRLLNLSSSKSLNPRASNALIVGDIFETFADHMGDMAKLHGMGLPVLDAIKWFNFKERIDRDDGTYDTRTLQGAMEQAFGSAAGSYFRTLMKDINGQTENGDRGGELWSRAIGRFKAASVGANLRVALLQPTAYVRASRILKPKYMAAAFGDLRASVFNAAGASAAWKEAMQHSGEMVWKDIGGYDTDLARTMRGQIQHDDSVMDKLVEASMLGAEWGDKLTWGRLWAACKLQAKGENKSLSGKALMEATEDLFREVIYSSQVMDSTLTRSELMRARTIGSKMVTPFMAEPTVSINILMDAASDLRNDERRLGRAEAWAKHGKKIGKAFAVYASSAAAAALAESLWDAVRDDDDEEYWKKFLAALFGDDNAARIWGDELDEKAKSVVGSAYSANLWQDLSIPGKLPVLKDVISLLSGYQSTNMATDAYRNIINAYQIWRETIDLRNGVLEKPTKVTYYGKMTKWGKIYKSLQGLSQLTGLPMYGLTRDAVAIWNTVMNGRKDDWKLRTYDANQLSGSKLSGYRELVEPTGVSQKDYQRMLQEINADGNSGISQAEAGAYLQAGEAAGRLTHQQATAIWSAATSGKKTYDEWASENRYGKGNIDLFDRDTGLYDSHGNLMTLKSISFEEDGKEILIPTIVKKNGQWVELSEQEAIDWYHRTGEYLGKFKSIEAANKYAQQLHLIQEMLYK